MPETTFEIKRGMVFYLETPGDDQIGGVKCTTMLKKRPYLVISNDSVNDHSDYIHVCPFTTKPPKRDYMYWYVPIKKRDGSITFVKPNETICIPKSLCTIANYSEALSSATLGNIEAMTRVSYVIAQHFGFENMLRDNVPVPVNNQTQNVQTNPVQMSDSIQLSLDIAGFGPINLTLKRGDATTDSNEQTVEVENVESKDESVAESAEDETSKYKDASGRLNPDGVHAITETILTSYRKFGGSLSLERIAKMYGLANSTVATYIRRIKDAVAMGDDPYKPHKRYTPVRLSKQIYNRFMSDYAVLSREDMLKRYGKFGFSGIDHIVGYYYDHISKHGSPKREDKVKA